MITCLNSLFCKECRVESDGLMSFISMFSSFSRQEMPATTPLCFVCFLELSIMEYQESGSPELKIHIVVSAPWGLTMGDSYHQPPFKPVSETIARAVLAIPYGEIEFMEFGQYLFEVYVNDKLLNTTALNITQSRT